MRTAGHKAHLRKGAEREPVIKIYKNDLLCFYKKHSVNVRQVYNPRISDWELCEMPICEECRKKEERQHEVL